MAGRDRPAQAHSHKRAAVGVMLPDALELIAPNRYSISHVALLIAAIDTQMTCGI